LSSISWDEGYIDIIYYEKLKADAYNLIKVLNGYIASLKRQKAKDEKITK
jgi:hypothetical protein